MNLEDQLNDLRTELANFTGRIKTIRTEVEPTSFEQRRQELYQSRDWKWLDSIEYLFWFVDGPC